MFGYLVYTVLVPVASVFSSQYTLYILENSTITTQPDQILVRVRVRGIPELYEYPENTQYRYQARYRYSYSTYRESRAEAEQSRVNKFSTSKHNTIDLSVSTARHGTPRYGSTTERSSICVIPYLMNS